MLWNEVLHMLQWLENTIGPTQQTMERPSASANLVQQKPRKTPKDLSFAYISYIIVGLSETIINSTSDCKRSLLFSVSCSPGRPELLPHQAGSETRLS